MSSYFDFLKKRGGSTGNESCKSNDIKSSKGGRVLPHRVTSPVTSGNALKKTGVLLPAIPTQKEAVVTVEPKAREVVPAVTGVPTQNDKDINYLYHERAGILQYDGGVLSK